MVHETAGRDPGASAAVFDPAQNRMDVAYWADRGVVIHQAAHGWFNGDLLADRWANEGFATFYALRAAEQLGEAADSPQMTDEARAASFPLNAWAASDGQGTTTAADAYGYAASLELANALADRVGTDVLAAVWSDAAAGAGAYQPPLLDTDAGGGVAAGAATPEGVGGVPDWRGAARPARGAFRPGPDPALARVGRSAGRGGVARCTGRCPRLVRAHAGRWPTAGSCRARSATRSGAGSSTRRRR